MSDDNKRNVQYFEHSSMRRLFEQLQTRQNENNQRFLCLSIERDNDKFCCIALTNPTEVIIKDGSVYGTGADVTGNALRVRIG